MRGRPRKYRLEAYATLGAPARSERARFKAFFRVLPSGFGASGELVFTFLRRTYPDRAGARPLPDNDPREPEPVADCQHSQACERLAQSLFGPHRGPEI